MSPKDDLPANDNEDPDEPWKRADFILQAYSGADLNVTDNQKTAITQLMTDLMHYCEVMSIGSPENHPDHIDFEDLLVKAYEDYWVQAYTMKGPIEADAKRTVALFKQQSAEIRAANDPARQPDIGQAVKDSKTDGDIQDPKLALLLKNLEERQEKERVELIGDFERQIKRHGGDLSMKFYQDQLEERKNDFIAERERYISEYHRANAIKDEMEKSESDSLEKGLDPDKPKRTR